MVAADAVNTGAIPFAYIGKLSTLSHAVNMVAITAISERNFNIDFIKRI
jgi:hypothetical protein